MIQSRFCVVLEHTSHPGNIGSVARAMKTMGLSDLRLVNAVDHHDQQAYARASGADDILFHAKCYTTIEEALFDCHQVIGLSARQRSSRTPMSSTQLIPYLKEWSYLSSIAFLFGNETNGLSNHALSFCHQQVTIPTDPNFKSLNLAASVQIIAYLCFCAQLNQHNTAMTQPLSSIPTDTEPATFANINALVERINDLMSQNDYQLPQNQQNFPDTLRQILFKQSLSKKEIDCLHGLVKHLNQKLSHQ